jgi:hypothetical protein
MMYWLVEGMWTLIKIALVAVVVLLVLSGAARGGGTAGLVFVSLGLLLVFVQQVRYRNTKFERRRARRRAKNQRLGMMDCQVCGGYGGLTVRDTSRAGMWREAREGGQSFTSIRCDACEGKGRVRLT